MLERLESKSNLDVCMSMQVIPFESDYETSASDILECESGGNLCKFMQVIFLESESDENLCKFMQVFF